MTKITTQNPVLLFEGGTTTEVELISWYDEEEAKIFWVIVKVGREQERVPIWSDFDYENKINNWNISLLVRDLKSYYENDRSIVEFSKGKSNWDMFNLSMMSNPRFNQVYNQCLSVAPILANSLPTALDQVTTKGTTLFNLVFNQICSIGGATVEDRLAWGSVAEDNNLPQDFIDILKGES